MDIDINRFKLPEIPLPKSTQHFHYWIPKDTIVKSGEIDKIEVIYTCECGSEYHEFWEI